MKFKKKTEKNIFAEGLENSVLHPYIKSSYNFINEDLDDEIEIGNEEVPVEDNSEGTPETPKPGVETGYSNMLINAINGEWDTIELYNSIIATLSLEKDKKYDAIIKILQDITNEENIHVGQLQKALEILSPNTASIKDGEKEADEQISADDYDDITEGLLVEAETEETTEEQTVDSEKTEEKTTRDTISDLLNNSKNPNLKDAVTTEKMFVSSSDEDALEILVKSVKKDEAVEPEVLDKFEDTAKNLGAEVNIGDIAKKYGMNTDDIVEQTTSSKLDDKKKKTVIFALISNTITDSKEHIEICKQLLDRIPD